MLDIIGFSLRFLGRSWGGGGSKLIDIWTKFKPRQILSQVIHGLVRVYPLVYSR